MNCKPLGMWNLGQLQWLSAWKVGRQVRTLEGVREYFMASVGRSYLYIAHMKVA